MVIVISKKYSSIGLISEKYKAKRSGENIVSPHLLALWNTIKYKTKKFPRTHYNYELQ
jgi:hypothetical protein